MPIHRKQLYSMYKLYKLIYFIIESLRIYRQLHLGIIISFVWWQRVYCIALVFAMPQAQEFEGFDHAILERIFIVNLKRRLQNAMNWLHMIFHAVSARVLPIADEACYSVKLDTII